MTIGCLVTFCHSESPLNDVAVQSVPVIAIVLAVCKVDAVVALPLMSSALVMLKPLPEITIALVVAVPAAVLIIIPFVISPARGEAWLV